MATILPDQPLSPANAGIDEVVSLSTGTQTAHIHEESGNADSPSIEAEMLLKALRNVIIPLVHPADGEFKHDANQNILGRDGREFVIALEKFMSSFLRSRQGLGGGIEVELKESQVTSDDDLTKDVADVAPHAEPLPDSPAFAENRRHQGLRLMQVRNKESPDGSVVSIRGLPSISDTDTVKQQKSRFIKKALNALRKHVFDAMPIRLLYFKPNSSKLQITLIERGEIYAHIASNFANGIDFLKVSREITDEDTRQKEYSYTHYTLEEAEQTVIERLIKKYSRYAILSHTWLCGASREVTYGDWIRGEFNAQQPGYRKLVNFCITAWKDDGVGFGWMDTVCINKESSSELDESIRSMYKWYQHASVCITYLADTVALSDIHNNSWFTRGWTLQELLAPTRIKFYNTHWNQLVESDENDKRNSVILKQVGEATTITADELQQSISYIPISRRMQMAAKRQVTREEDSAYSLMGIFDISMATAYGEGAERAFSRLLQEVFNSESYYVADIFNWAGSDNSRISSLLPSRLQDYLHRSSGLNSSARPIEPIMLTHLGLRITIVLMAAISLKNPHTESQYDPFGNYHAVADISLHPTYLRAHKEANTTNRSYSILDARISDSDGWNKKRNLFQLTLGVLNVGGEGNTSIWVPKSCLAVALQSDNISLKKFLPNPPLLSPLT